MLKENVTQLMQKLDFPRTAQNELLNTLDFLLQNDDFLNIVNRYNCDEYNINEMVEDITTLAEGKGICLYTAHMLLFLSMAPILHNRFKQKGISDEIFYDTMRDLRYKLIECSLVYGKCGTFVPKWYKGFFDMKIFALGRLHFELTRMPFDYKDICKKGHMVLSCHIPASGPLLLDEVEESFKLACDFFKISGPMVVVCSSWLLYPRFYEEVFKKGSNLSKFYELFDIVESNERAITADAWRVFGTLETDLDKLPQETTLQRNLLEFLKAGNSMGGGYGVLVRNYE